MRRWHAPKQGGYMVFVNEGFNCVVPQSDIQPHSIYEISCACSPESSVSEESNVLHIIHQSFEEKEAIEKSLDKIFS